MALFDQFGQPMAQGPTTQQPQSNAVLDQAVSRMATSSERTLDTVKELHEVIKKMPSSVSEVSKKMENLGFELEDTVKFADDAADAMKQVAKIAGTLRRGIVNTKNLKDAVHAAEELAEAQKLIQQRARAGTKEYEQAAKAHKRLNEFAKSYANYQGESNDAMKEFSKVLHETVGDVDELQRKLKSVSLNHLTRQVHGVSKAMRAAGIDPFGIGTKMDKYVAGAEVKKKVKEITEARKMGNVSAARERAEKAKEWVRIIVSETS
jgi:methyl-accepting chemotaxis protein